MGQGPGFTFARKVPADSGGGGPSSRGPGRDQSAEKGWLYAEPCKKSGAPPGGGTPVSLYSFQHAEKEIAFNFCILITVAAVNGVLPDGGGKQLTDGAGCGLGWIGGPDQCAEISHCIVFLQDRGDDGPAAHEFHQFAIKRPGLMDCVELS